LAKKICRKCATELQEDWDFCPKCGKKYVPPERIYPLRQVVKTDKPLTTEDWKVILALPFEGVHKDSLKDIRRNRNEPTLICGDCRGYNSVFVVHGLPYRIMPARYSGQRISTRHKIYITVPRE
jgi:hypothetical protein